MNAVSIIEIFSAKVPTAKIQFIVYSSIVYEMKVNHTRQKLVENQLICFILTFKAQPTLKHSALRELPPCTFFKINKTISMSLKVEFCKKRGLHWEMCEEDVTPRGQISLDGPWHLARGRN